MKLKYINQIRANLTISSNKKTSNILDGTYKSVYKGKSMNFENLREYVISDDVKDIDWKASSRSGSLLVKQFIAEKKHNILLLMDTGTRMGANANKEETKKELALFTAGTLGYLATKNGDYVGMIYNRQGTIQYKPFQYDLYHLEQYLTEYEKEGSLPNTFDINTTLQYVSRNIKKRMIIFLITDLHGMETIDTKTLTGLSYFNDLFLLSIDDIAMKENDTFDIEEEKYLPNFLMHDNALAKVAEETKEKLYQKKQKEFQKCQCECTCIHDKKEISLQVIELLERHKYGSNR